MNTSHASKISVLKDRAAMLARSRDFFSKRNILEVDTPLLSASASVDAHIDLIPATLFGTQTRYLHSSPEYGMKRLLSQGMGDIYQLSHVFRDGELGRLHSPEFMLAEWYRVGFTFEMMIEETLDFIRLFLGELPSETLSYNDAFHKFLQIDPSHISDEELNLLLANKIEPHLGKDKLTVLWGYPASQAALAKVREDGQSERFEIYYKGVELCNGYHELTDVTEQRKRLVEANSKRIEPLPIDENFLKALESGVPDCCGVAVGFDRLMMLKRCQKELSSVTPFSWEES